MLTDINKGVCVCVCTVDLKKLDHVFNKQTLLLGYNFVKYFSLH